ncbi:hypothetical protein GCM10009665_67640 [Kitasatospora nipponensis]|uniref:Esterase n=1 Tax=Kitasatospora nipponensis TaxID=258049 RepID=A0ABP4HMP3_9ACTN
MPRLVLVLLLLPVLLLGVRLARSAVTRLRGERAAQTYELGVDLRPVLVRAGGALLCGVCATALAVVALLNGRGLPSAGNLRVTAAAGAVGAPDPAARPVPAPVPAAAAAASPVTASGASPAAPSAGAAAASPSVGTPKFETVGHPAEGELLQGAVPGADGRPRTVRVWLPAHYGDDPAARFPVLVLHAAAPGRTADAEVPDVFDGLTSAIKLGRARPFVVVAPAGPTGTAHPCDLVAAAPQALADDARIRAAVSAAFHTLPPGPQGWATLGIDGGAPCAVAAGLTRPDLYGAAAAVSGRYDAPSLVQAAADSPSGPPAQLLLAAAKDDTDGLAAARRLQGALHTGKGQAARAVVKVSDVVQDYTPDRERLRLVRLAAQYLVDALAHPTG